MREIKPFRTVLGVYKKLAITTVSNALDDSVNFNTSPLIIISIY